MRSNVQFAQVGDLYTTFSKFSTLHPSSAEVKRGRAGLVLGWVTAWEYPVSWVPFSFIRLSRARGDYNRARVMQFRRTRRRFGCKGNPTELVHWSQCFTVVRKHGDHSLPGEILAVTIFEGKPECHVLPSFSWFGFQLLCEVVEYVAVVFCTCLWLT